MENDIQSEIREYTAQIGKVEREKAQLDLLTQQLQDQKADLEKRMKEAGVTPETLDGKIAELRGKLADQMKIIREGQAATPADPIGALSI